MNLRLMVALAVGFAALVLIPVLVVVGLGVAAQEDRISICQTA